MIGYVQCSFFPIFYVFIQFSFGFFHFYFLSIPVANFAARRLQARSSSVYTSATDTAEGLSLSLCCAHAFFAVSQTIITIVVVIFHYYYWRTGAPLLNLRA